MNTLPNFHHSSNPQSSEENALHTKSDDMETREDQKELGGAFPKPKPKLKKRQKLKKIVRVKIDELSETENESKGKGNSEHEVQNLSECSEVINKNGKTRSAKLISQNIQRKGNLATCIKSLKTINKNSKSEKEIKSSKSIKFSEKRDVFTYKTDAKFGYGSNNKNLRKVAKLFDEDEECCKLI